MAPAAYRLVVHTGPNPGTLFELTRDVATVGRDVTNEIVLGDPEVSRQHARLTRTPAGYVLEDLGSTNGTYVNGERLAAPRVLTPGDSIGLGENIILGFESTSPESEATVMGAPPPPPKPGVQPVYPPHPTPQQPQAQVIEPQPKPRSGTRNWILAGCGCLVLLAACIGLLFFMDAYYPDILYGPIRPLLQAIGF
jgi:predicted component of type VI protein secretion system